MPCSHRILLDNRQGEAKDYSDNEQAQDKSLTLQDAAQMTSFVTWLWQMKRRPDCSKDARPWSDEDEGTDDSICARSQRVDSKFVPAGTGIA